MPLIYGWPLDRLLGTDSSFFLAPALSLDSAFTRCTDPPLSLPDATWGRGREKMLDGSLLFSRSWDAEFSRET